MVTVMTSELALRERTMGMRLLKVLPNRPVKKIFIVCLYGQIQFFLVTVRHFTSKMKKRYGPLKLLSLLPIYIVISI